MSVEDYMLSCPTKKFLGIDCFGCGTQRSIALLFEGKFAEAFQMFPAIYTLIVFLFFVVINFVDQRRDYSKFILFFAVISVVIMLVSFFIKHPL